MLNYVAILLVFNLITSETNALWDKDARCPLICTCSLQHLSETAIYRFMQGEKKETYNEVDSTEINNDVFYEENLEKVLLEDTPIIRSTTCILQTETNPLELIESLPKDIESLTFIQGYESGNKTIKFSDLLEFSKLISLELIGANLLNKESDSHLICEIDNPIPEMKYLNLERILIKNSKKQIQNFVKEITDDVLTFEYVQTFDTDSHPLTMIQKGTNEEILPYEKFKEQAKTNEVPLFIGFKNLYLLRISNCELNSVHWEMFDGLQSLQYLILEKNNLRFIPAFAFYGTPSLKTLSLAHNSLLDIQITDLAGLLELEYLDLSYNNFSQLSELSLPPFPKLKLANFANNPISIIFPNTFEVMNTTDSLVIGSDDMPLKLITNSFTGLNLLKVLTLNNLKIRKLKRDLLVGMPNLQELVMTGNITEIEYDTFLDVYRLEKLILSNCEIKNISMDAFIGMEKLKYLDLSKNKIEYLPPGVFDQLSNIKEIYLNNNQLTQLPKHIFSNIHPKLLRLNENPWHCSCDMSSWKPMLINRIKQKVTKPCDLSLDKGIGCEIEKRFIYKYVYNNKVAPRCTTPRKFEKWSVFQTMRKELRCPNYKPKLKKRVHNNTTAISSENMNNSSEVYLSQSQEDKASWKQSKLDYLNYKLLKHESLQAKSKLNKISTNYTLENLRQKVSPVVSMKQDEIDNNLNVLPSFNNLNIDTHNEHHQQYDMHDQKQFNIHNQSHLNKTNSYYPKRRFRKVKKHRKPILNKNATIENSINMIN